MFTDTHPAVMQERVARTRSPFRFDTSRRRGSLKVRVLGAVERATGWRIGEFRNYKLLK